MKKKKKFCYPTEPRCGQETSRVRILPCWEINDNEHPEKQLQGEGRLRHCCRAFGGWIWWSHHHHHLSFPLRCRWTCPSIYWVSSLRYITHASRVAGPQTLTRGRTVRWSQISQNKIDASRALDFATARFFFFFFRVCCRIDSLTGP